MNAEVTRIRPFSIGILVNPVAGLGGPLALKGSDELPADVVPAARSHAGDRLGLVIDGIDLPLPRAGVSEPVAIRFVTCPAPMGAEVLVARGLAFELVETAPLGRTTADDTRRLARRLEDAGIDLLLFAGGDGTARDLCDVLPPGQLVLGVPSGVKMHSGVFANRPVDASRVIVDLALGRLTSVVDGEVRDIDEAAFRQGTVRSRFYGELTVPLSLRHVQRTKVGGRESEPLVLTDIAAFVVERMAPGVQYFIGSGTTTAAVMAALGCDNTLLGVDVVRDGELLLRDATEAQLFELAGQGPTRIVLTVMGGQGHLLGRGNQQLSPRVLRRVGIDNLMVIATRTKLLGLESRPLVVDTGDPALDDELAGVVRIIAGYEDEVLYRIGDDAT